MRFRRVRQPPHAIWLYVHNGMGVCSNCHRLDGIDPLATHCRKCITAKTGAAGQKSPPKKKGRLRNGSKTHSNIH